MCICFKFLHFPSGSRKTTPENGVRVFISPPFGEINEPDPFFGATARTNLRSSPALQDWAARHPSAVRTSRALLGPSRLSGGQPGSPCSAGGRLSPPDPFPYRIGENPVGRTIALLI